MEMKDELTGVYKESYEQMSEYLQDKELYPDELVDTKQELHQNLIETQREEKEISELVGSNLFRFADQTLRFVQGVYLPKKVLWHMLEAFWKTLIFACVYNVIECISQHNWRLWNGEQDALLCYAIAVLSILIEDIIVVKMRSKRDMGSTCYRFRVILPYLLIILFAVVITIVTDVLKIYAMTSLLTIFQVTVASTVVGGITYVTIVRKPLRAFRLLQKNYEQEFLRQQKKKTDLTRLKFATQTKQQNKWLYKLCWVDVALSGMGILLIGYLLFINRSWQLWIGLIVFLVLYAAACAFLTSWNARQDALEHMN